MSYPPIKEFVKNNTAYFTHYFDGDLWYAVKYKDGFNEELAEFAFPVPINDCGNATFLAEDKAMLFMRYINKQLKALAKINA